jgi:uncharacterized ferritin-like protein (DUF455 family)
MRSQEQRLAEAAAEEARSFELVEKHLRNLIKAYGRLKRARSKANRVQKRVEEEARFGAES